MTNRITEKMIEARVTYLNELTGNPIEPWLRNGEGRSKANIGNYHTSHAYGGVNVQQMTNEGGGVCEPIQCGHSPKRELFDKLCAFINGIEVAKSA